MANVQGKITEAKDLKPTIVEERVKMATCSICGQAIMGKVRVEVANSIDLTGAQDFYHPESKAVSVKSTVKNKGVEIYHVCGPDHLHKAYIHTRTLTISNDTRGD